MRQLCVGGVVNARRQCRRSPAARRSPSEARAACSDVLARVSASARSSWRAGMGRIVPALPSARHTRSTLAKSLCAGARRLRTARGALGSRSQMTAASAQRRADLDDLACSLYSAPQPRLWTARLAPRRELCLTLASHPSRPCRSSSLPGRCLSL